MVNHVSPKVWDAAIDAVSEIMHSDDNSVDNVVSAALHAVAASSGATPPSPTLARCASIHYRPSETLEQAVRTLLESREQMGVAKYGETLDTSTGYDWPEMREQELLDALMYAAKERRGMQQEIDFLAARLKEAESLLARRRRK